MRMKKKLAGALVCGALMVAMTAMAGTARADDGSSVELYGILDAAIGTVEHSAGGSADFPGTVNPVNKVSPQFRHAVWGMFNGGISPSRWGLRGNENLGGGLAAYFDLESAINLPTGEASNAAGSIAGANDTVAVPSAINGQLFSRAAYVGLKDNAFGALQFGRSTTLGFDAIVDYDPLFSAQLFSPLGFSGSYSAGGITEGSRTDNNIKYTNHIGPFNFGASYSFGGVAGAFGAGSTFGVAAGFEQHGFGIEGTYYSDRDVLHSGALAGVNAATGANLGASVGALSPYNDHGAMVVAKYSLGPATFKAGYEHYQLQALSVNGIASLLPASYFGYAYTLAKGSTTNNNLYFIGGDYKITPVFDVAIGIYDTQTTSTNGNQENGGNQWQYSLLADYRLSRRTDIYAGYMFSKFNGSSFNGYESTNYIAAVGLRTKF